MNRDQLTALLVVSSTCNTRTIHAYKSSFATTKKFGVTAFTTKKYGVTAFEFLMINGYIEVEPSHKKYCRVTDSGNAVIEALVNMTELLPNKYKQELPDIDWDDFSVLDPDNYDEEGNPIMNK